MNNKVLRNLSYGMYVVGAKDDKYVGCIANSIMQITSDPKTIAISINHDNYTNKIIKKTNRFSVSILKENTNLELIGTFGYKSSKDIDKYESIDYEELDALPVLKNSCGVIICEVIDKLETPTHTVFLGKVTNMSNYEDAKPMTYKYYHEVLKGKSPKNAPTFENEEALKVEKTIWKCQTCGYEVELDELPEDYICPICGRGKEAFKQK